MRIVLHKTDSVGMLASFASMGGPPWLGTAYHSMGNGYELRVESLGKDKAIIFIRPLNTKKTANIVVPLVGYSMPVDINIDESGKPIWGMSDVVERLLGDFELPATNVCVHSAGQRLYLPWKMERKLEFSEGSRYLPDAPNPAIGGALGDAVDDALWMIDTHRRHDKEIVHDVHVWSGLSQRLDEQERLWVTLRKMAASAA